MIMWLIQTLAAICALACSAIAMLGMISQYEPFEDAAAGWAATSAIYFVAFCVLIK
jgi:hypothetical protein